jgi:hypothetical protein
LSFRLWQKDDEVDTIYGTNQGQRWKQKSFDSINTIQAKSS